MKNSYLKIDTNIRDYFGSSNTAIVFGRLMYWFGKKESFYKFKQPCKKNPLYKVGDSWGEELGMSRYVLNPIMSRLVNHYKTKSAYLKSEDKFGGKIFCSYTSHKTCLTHYFVDREALATFLESISVKKLPPSPPLKSGDVAKAAKTLTNFPSSDAVSPPHFAHTHPDHTVLQTITSLSGDVPKDGGNDQAEEDKLISKNMVDTWNSHMQDTVIWYPSYAERLCKVLREFFQGCLQTFKQYCLTVASADFLTGKAKNSRFKAFLWWAIKPEKIQMILEGAYGVKSFFTIKSPEQRKIEADIKALESDLKTVEHRISKNSEEIHEGRMKQISDHKLSLSPEALEALRKKSDRDYFERNPGQECVNDHWSERLLSIHFDGRDGFLNRKLMEQFGFIDTIIPPKELTDQRKWLLAEIDLKYQQRDEFNRKNKGWRNFMLYTEYNK